MSRYVGLIDGKAGAYGVTVPDLPGCNAGGATTDEAMKNAVEAVRIWIEDAGAEVKADDIASGPRVGIAYAEEDALKPWRFWLKDSAFVSRK